jgi:bacteriocin biosynthesis cyclodehydratase domain-containing protein
MNYLCLQPGSEWVLTSSDEIILRAATAQATLKSECMEAFLDDVLPLLHEGADLATIAKSSEHLPIEELERLLGELLQSGMVQSVESLSPPSHIGVMTQMIAAHGRREEAVSHRLKGARLAVFGLESAGATLARQLATWSPAALVLVDPSPPRPDDPSALIGETRQAALAEEIRAGAEDLRVETPLDAWSAAAVHEAAEHADVLIAAVDRDFAAVAHWVNQASAALSKPSAFLKIDGALAEIGPIVYPGETACYMCYRMRAIACADDYAATMAFEERRDQQRNTSARREPTFLPSLSVAAGILAGELAKTLTAAGRHPLAGRVMLWDGMEGSFSEHDVFRQPACPVCEKKNS